MELDQKQRFSESKAIIWSSIERFSSQGIGFVLGIIMARLLTPSSYGLVAMLSIFMAVCYSFVDSGFGTALIQKKDCNEKDYSTVFYFNLVVSITLYILFFIASPFIAVFYGEPQLELITKISTISLIINSFSIVQKVKLSKMLDFKSQSKATIISTILSGLIGITLAYRGFGVWALIIQGLVGGVVTNLVLWYISRWRPSLVFSKASLKTLFGFGSKLLATGLLQTIYVNLYSLMIGKYYSSNDLGLFNKMQNLAIFPSKNFTNIVARAVFPEQCNLQDNNEALLLNYKKLFSLSSYIIFPLMMGVSALSKPLILVLLGENWIDGYPYLMIFCFAYMFDHIQYFNWQILAVKGRSDLSLRSEVIKKVVAIFIMVITIQMGIEYMIWGILVYSLCDMAIIIPFVQKVLPQINYMVEFRIVGKPFMISFVMFVTMLITVQMINNKYLQLIIPFISGCIVFLIISIVTKSDELKYFVNKIKELLCKK